MSIMAPPPDWINAAGMLLTPSDLHIFSVLPNFSNMAIGILNFERLFPNFIADTMNWFLNSMLD